MLASAKESTLYTTFHWHHAASLALVLTGLFISERGKR